MTDIVNAVASSDTNKINYPASALPSGVVAVQKLAEAKSAPVASRPANGNGMPAAGMPGNLTNLTNGMWVRKINNGFTQAIMAELFNVSGQMNPIAQFSIDNSGGGAANQNLIIGSVLGDTGSYVYYGQSASAADNAVIVDQFGAGCRFTIGFSRLVSFMPVVVSEIKFSSTNTLQVNLPFSHKVLFPTDAVVYPLTNNIGFTQEKSDFRTTLSVAVGKWVLGPNQYFQYQVLATATVTIWLKISAIGNVKSMTMVE